MFKNLVSFPMRAVKSVKYRVLAVSVMAFGALMAAAPVSALATETETEKGVHEIASKVSEEGVTIVLAILSALVALLVAIIVIPKAIGLIRRFI
jgi:hypothetical protein